MKTGKFEPMRLVQLSQPEYGKERLTVTCTLKGDIVAEFEKMLDESGLNRSQLVTQMVYHCLNRSDDLKEFYRRLAVLR